MDRRCSEKVWHQFRYLPCRSYVSVEREGKLYCATHDPVRKAQKERERQVEYLKEREIHESLLNQATERSKKLGVGSPYYDRISRSGGYTGGVMLSAADADALIKRIELLQEAYALLEARALELKKNL